MRNYSRSAKLSLSRRSHKQHVHNQKHFTLAMNTNHLCKSFPGLVDIFIASFCFCQRNGIDAFSTLALSTLHQGYVREMHNTGKGWGRTEGTSSSPCKEGRFKHCHPRHSFLICNLTKAEENIYLLSHKCTYIPTQLPPWIPRKCNFCCCFTE